MDTDEHGFGRAAREGAKGCGRDHGFPAFYRGATTGKLGKVRAGTGRPAAGEPLRSSHGYHGAVVSHKVPAAQAKSVPLGAGQTPPAVGRSTILG